MKKLKLKKEIIIAGIIIITIAFIGMSFKSSKVAPVEPNNLTEFKINNQKYSLQRGEELSVSAWDDIEVMYQNEYYKDIPTITNNVTVGTKYQDVLKIFDIQEGYAIVNMEVPTEEHDGTTDVIQEVYKNDKIFKKEYLDIYLLFGYKKVNKEWKMITAKELEKLTDTDKELLIYSIGINGLDDEMVSIGRVIAFSITHQ